MARKKMKGNSEDAHQEALISWAQYHKIPSLGLPVSDFLFHIPNGGSRHPAEAAKLKRMGVKKGVSDLLMPVKVGIYSGIWIEFKAPFTDSTDKNYPTKEQKDWLVKMREQGFAVQVCWGWLHARDIIINYLGGGHANN